MGGKKNKSNNNNDNKNKTAPTLSAIPLSSLVRAPRTPARLWATRHLHRLGGALAPPAVRQMAAREVHSAAVLRTAAAACTR